MIGPQHIKTWGVLLCTALMALKSYGQATQPVDFSSPKEYTLGPIRVEGIQYLDPDALLSISGLREGDKLTLPGDGLAGAARKLWDQGLLSDVAILADKISGDSVFLLLRLKERPRLSRFAFKGIRKGESNDLREKIGMARGRIVTDAVVKNSINVIKRFFVTKGFYNVAVKAETFNDSSARNTITVRYVVDKGYKVKISALSVEGNTDLTDDEVRKKLKDTKQVNPWRFFKASRFIQTKYEKDKARLLDWYSKNGYRDAAILTDSVYKVDDKHVNVVLKIEEGRKYYFRNVTWQGNYLYPAKTLTSVLNINRGDIYNQEMMDTRLNFNQTGADVSSLYLDDGYLFFRVTPTEIKVDGDSIDVEMRVYEGAQATINRIIVEGNTKTSDHVVLREIRTMPGQKFSRTDLIRTQRELSQLGYFNPETIGLQPMPNPQTGTVDIKYTLEEKPSDQIQMSGGWGGFFGFVGTLGLVFNNFSARKIFQGDEWRPLPSGDGQRLSINFQANGRQFQTYTMAFTEPWLGGRRPNALTVGFTRSVQSTYTSQTSNIITSGLTLNSVNVSLGRRLRWPDDYFVLSNSVSFQSYNLFNYFATSGLPVNNGILNQLSFSSTVSRNSLNNPVFPTAGSSFSFSLNATPPFSAFLSKPKTEAEKYRNVEFHKWMIDGSYFIPVAKNLVFNSRAHFGFLGYYTKAQGIGPFERFKLGGSGITGFNFLIGYDIIGLRGYQDNSISPTGANGAGIIFNKYVSELRYALSTNPAATIFVLAFAEGGNNVGAVRDFNPFNIYRSAGMGVRIMMPAFGLLGVDYGKPFDGPKNLHNGFTFSIGQQIR